MPKWLKLALVGGVVALLVLFFAGHFDGTKHLSARIASKAPDLGPGAYLLLPNLVKAKVYAPDRPHDPVEFRNIVM